MKVILNKNNNQIIKEIDNSNSIIGKFDNTNLGGEDSLGRAQLLGLDYHHSEQPVKTVIFVDFEQQFKNIHGKVLVEAERLVNGVLNLLVNDKQVTTMTRNSQPGFDVNAEWYKKLNIASRTGENLVKQYERYYSNIPMLNRALVIEKLYETKEFQEFEKIGKGIMIGALQGLHEVIFTAYAYIEPPLDIQQDIVSRDFNSKYFTMNVTLTDLITGSLKPGIEIIPLDYESESFDTQTLPLNRDVEVFKNRQNKKFWVGSSLKNTPILGTSVVYNIQRDYTNLGYRPKNSSQFDIIRIILNKYYEKSFVQVDKSHRSIFVVSGKPSLEINNYELKVSSDGISFQLREAEIGKAFLSFGEGIPNPGLIINKLNDIITLINTQNDNVIRLESEDIPYVVAIKDDQNVTIPSKEILPKT